MMAVDAIAHVTSLGVDTGVLPTTQRMTATPRTEFSTWLSSEFAKVDGQIKSADRAVQALALGQAEDLHRVVLEVERARLSVDLLVQVRNRVVEAYQEMLRLQI